MTRKLFYFMFCFFSVVGAFGQEATVLSSSGNKVTVNAKATTSTLGLIQLSGDLTGTAISPTLKNTAVTGQLLTGLSSVRLGVVSASDTILEAIAKLQNQIIALLAQEVTTQSQVNAATIGSFLRINNNVDIYEAVPNTTVFRQTATRNSPTSATASFTGVYGLIPDATTKNITVDVTSTVRDFSSSFPISDIFSSTGDFAQSGTANNTFTFEFSGAAAYVGKISFIAGRRNTNANEYFSNVTMTVTYEDGTTESKSLTGLTATSRPSFTFNSSVKVVTRIQLTLTQPTNPSNPGINNLSFGFYSTGNLISSNVKTSTGLYNKLANTGWPNIDLVKID